jgi:YHS domain-containing protein
MKKQVLFAGAALLLATSVWAEPAKEEAKPAAPTEIKCAVKTDNTVNIAEATEKKRYVDYNGNRYFFCCGGCPKAFNKDPQKYANNDHIAAPKEETPQEAPKAETPKK